MESMVLLLFAGILTGCVLLNLPILLALVMGLALFSSYGLLRHHTLPSLLKMALSGIRTVKNILLLFLLIGLLFLFVTARTLKSRVGRAWISIREDELAARSLGVNLKTYKMVNFAYATFWAGLIGAMYAAYLQYIDSSAFNMDEGFNILSMVIIGGQGTLVGPIIGSVIVNFLTEALRSIGQWRYVAYGALIIAMMWWRPQGLAGASNSVLAGSKLRKQKQEQEEEDTE